LDAKDARISELEQQLTHMIALAGERWDALQTALFERDEARRMAHHQNEVTAEATHSWIWVPCNHDGTPEADDEGWGSWATSATMLEGTPSVIAYVPASVADDIRNERDEARRELIEETVPLHLNQCGFDYHSRQRDEAERRWPGEGQRLFPEGQQP